MYKPGDNVAGRFVLIEQIGQGGAGTVYKAVQSSLEREVALKVLHSDAAFAPDARRRFAREARAVARLNHRNIAEVYDFGTDHDGRTLWIAMELIDGYQLRTLKGQPFNLVQTIRLADQICSALVSAHTSQIIHRDLKLQNVLVTRDLDGNELAKLVDFGLAFSSEEKIDVDDAPGIGDERTVVPPVLGTPRYMAPEILLGEAVDHRVDIYAFGVMLFELVTGRAPFVGEVEEVIRGHVSDPIPEVTPRHGTYIPAPLAQLIKRMLVKDRAFRIATATDVKAALMEIASSLAVGIDERSSGDPRSTFGTDVSLEFSTGAWHQSDAGGPVVGRDRQRRELENRIVNCLKHRQGGVAILRGERGAGKTRLVEWCRARVADTGMMRTARFSSVADSAVLGEIVLRITNDPPDLPVLQDRLEAIGLSTAEADTCARLGFPKQFAQRESTEFIHSSEPLVEDTVVDPGDVVEFEQIECVISLLVAQSARTPLLVVFDDVASAHPAVFELLHQLLEYVTRSPAPILALATMPPPALTQLSDRAEQVVRHRGTWVCDLEPLRAEDTVELLRQVAPISEHVARKISARAQGNPHHALETLDWYRVANGLEYGKEWTFRRDFDHHVEVPEPVAAQLNELRRLAVGTYANPEVAEEFLRHCAVLGYLFPLDLLGAVFDDDPTELVEHFVRYQALVRADDTVAFRHPMLCDVVAAEVKASRSMRELHRRVAHAKIAFYDDKKDDHSSELAEHFAQARDPSNAFYYFVKAARRAVARGDLSAGSRLYRRAESIGEFATSGLEEATTEMNTDHVRLEAAHLERRLGHVEAARNYYKSLVTSERPDIAAWSHWGLGMVAVNQGMLVDAQHWFDTMQTFGAFDAAAEGLATSTLALCRGDLIAASDAIREVGLQGTPIAHEIRVQRCLVGVESNDRDLDLHLVALDEASNSAGHVGLADYRLVNAIVAQKRGEWTESEQSLNLAEQLYSDMGQRWGQARVAQHRGMLRFQTGDYQAAYVLLKRSAELLANLDVREYGWVRLGIARLKRCTNQSAKSDLKRAYDIFESVGDFRGMAHVDLWRGLDVDAEARWFDCVAEVFSKCGDPVFRAIATGYSAIASANLGDHEQMNVTAAQLFELLDQVHVVERELLEIADTLSRYTSEFDADTAFFIEALAIDISTILR